MSYWAFIRAGYGWHLGAVTGAVAGGAVVGAEVAGWLSPIWLCACSPLVVIGGIVGVMVQRAREYLRQQAS